jgi:molybdate transport system substrate-binding protein
MKQWAAALAAVTTLLASCGSSPSGDTAAKGTTPGVSAPAPALTGKITILAAASLTESFTTLGHQFEAAHPGTKVILSFGASSTLATQITKVPRRMSSPRPPPRTWTR